MTLIAPIGYWSAVGLVLCGFCFVLFSNLLAGGYSRLAAFGLSLVSLAQPAYLEETRFAPFFSALQVLLLHGAP